MRRGITLRLLPDSRARGAARAKNRMKDSTKKLLDSVGAAHDWAEGQVYGGGGTRMSSTDTCRVCGLKRHWFVDRQNEVRDQYTFEAIDGTERSLAAVVEAGCR